MSDPGTREPAEGGRNESDEVDTETMGDDPEQEGGLISNTGDDTGEGEAPTG